MFKRLIERMSDHILSRLEVPVMASLQIQQKLLIQENRERVLREGKSLPLEDIECKIFSQNGEDGIISYLFSIVEPKTRRFFEIGIEKGTECNSANLAKNFGWSGWLVEGNASWAEQAQRHYNSHPMTWTRDIKIISQYVTEENINSLIDKYEIKNNVDFFSLDIDSLDYWIFKKMQDIGARVVCIEYNASFGPDLSVTVPKDGAFYGVYSGASLKALVKLAKEKGYRFVGCNSTGVNAFFVRSDLAQKLLPEVPVTEGFRYHCDRTKKIPFMEQFEKLKVMPLTEV
jgi:hypothetical protein